MGLDGGTIVTRTDHLRRASWRLANNDGGANRSTRGGQLGGVDATTMAGVERRSVHQDSSDGFCHCALSGVRLPAQPAPGEVVACSLGRLYLRDGVVEYITRSNQFAPGNYAAPAVDAACGHIERLRDVFAVSLVPNPEWSAPRMETVEGNAPSLPGAWLCPVDRGTCSNGQHAFAALRPCGHAMRLSVAQELGRGRGGGGGGGGGGGEKRTLSDGISTLQGGRWECPCCSAAVEVVVRLMAPDDVVEKVRATLRQEREARAERKRRKREGQAGS